MVFFYSFQWQKFTDDGILRYESFRIENAQNATTHTTNADATIETKPKSKPIKVKHMQLTASLSLSLFLLKWIQTIIQYLLLQWIFSFVSRAMCRSPRRRHRSPLPHYHDYRSRDRHIEPFDDRSSATSRVRQTPQFNVSMFQNLTVLKCVCNCNRKHFGPRKGINFSKQTFNESVIGFQREKLQSYPKNIKKSRSNTQ